MSTSKRTVCGDCGRPQAVCVCDALVRVTAPVDVIIWQDPTEAKHKLSTAPLLHLSVTNSRLLIGDKFSVEDVFGTSDITECALLFPLETERAVTKDQRPSIKKLLILDGTWRKVRRLFHLNPWLYDMPFVRFQPEQSSRYIIRKSPREDGLSTIEAGAAALVWLSDNSEYQDILAVFERFVALQMRHKPM